ncbi:MAG: hypothetical protein NT128_04820 [Proteobacteria bacterium]|nr:hypothetical protein [Pseudomonadota bacterium]
MQFTGSGLADFSRYALHKVRIQMTGKNWLDFSAANKTMGWKETPSGMTWHHHYDGRTMCWYQAKAIFARPAVPHTGGAAIVKMVKGTE